MREGVMFDYVRLLNPFLLFAEEFDSDLHNQVSAAIALKIRRRERSAMQEADQESQEFRWRNRPFGKRSPEFMEWVRHCKKNKNKKGGSSIRPIFERTAHTLHSQPESLTRDS